MWGFQCNLEEDIFYLVFLMWTCISKEFQNFLPNCKKLEPEVKSIYNISCIVHKIVQGFAWNLHVLIDEAKAPQLYSNYSVIIREEPTVSNSIKHILHRSQKCARICLKPTTCTDRWGYKALQLYSNDPVTIREEPSVSNSII